MTEYVTRDRGPLSPARYLPLRGRYEDSAGFASGRRQAGRLTSDAGILLLAAVEQRPKITERLAA